MAGAVGHLPPNVPPIVKDAIGYLMLASRAYLTLAHGDSAAALREFLALPDSACRPSAEQATLSPSAKLHPTFLVGLSHPVSGRSVDGTYAQTSGPSDPVPRASPVFLLIRSLRL